MKPLSAAGIVIPIMDFIFMLMFRLADSIFKNKKTDIGYCPFCEEEHGQTPHPANFR